MSSEPASALVTVDDVTRLVAERDQLAAKLAEIEGRVAAIRQFLGDARFSEIVGDGEAKEPRSFRDVMQAALEEAPHGLTYEELRQALRDEGLSEALERSPNNFFNTISRMQRLGIAEKIGERLVANAFVDAMPDEVRAALESESARSGAPSAVMNVLINSTAPMTAAQVIEAVHRNDPAIGQQRIYAALSRLSGEGGSLVRTEDGRYRHSSSKWSDANLFDSTSE